ncbi:MAG: tilS [Bacteriovoracaceae bacterium]|nr:tilS [Bacteriovoracaceae bacterium]
MLESIVAKNLLLKTDERRHFFVSVSGGLDSVILLHVLYLLQKTYPLDLEVFHVNFQLRGKESAGDEKFVSELAKHLKLPLHLKKIKIRKGSAVQESARLARLALSKDLPGGELVEAHHGDDQIETFLFRLFRGSGLHGLSAMSIKSDREGRTVWRPFLGISKAELVEFAKSYRLRFREDSSNKTLKYDRNWIRLQILPTIEKRFPAAKGAILRAIDQIQQAALSETLVGAPESLRHGCPWDRLKSLTKRELQNWIHGIFRKDFGIFVSRQQILGLAEKIHEGKAFSFNAPKGLIIRGKLKSRTVPEAKIVVLATKKQFI